MKKYKAKDLGYSRATTKAYAKVTFPNGELWIVPVQAIADSLDEEYSDDCNDTIGHGDPLDLIDWAKDNMNWKELEPYARKVKPATIDLEEAWCEATIEIPEEL